jgi:hypothetical protein
MNEDLTDNNKINRPMSVTIVSIYYWLQALALWSSGIISALSLLNISSEYGNNHDRITATVVFTVVTIPLAIACTMAGWGLWKLRTWARSISIGMSILGLVVVGVPIIINRQFSDLLYAITNILVLVVLFKTNVKSSFKKP